MKPQTVDQYIAAAPLAARAAARKLRAVIKKAAPEALEKISYAMPYYGYKGRLIYWGAYQEYLGVYIMSAAREALAKEIEPYRTAKATLHFAHNQPLPVKLIDAIVKTQMAANNSKLN